MNTTEQNWMEPPPGTHIVKEGFAQEGDWFYIPELGAWGLVPKIGLGSPVCQCDTLIARGLPDFTNVTVVSNPHGQN